jgi:hypothetical protein
VVFKEQDIAEVIPDTRPGVNRLGAVVRINKVRAWVGVGVFGVSVDEWQGCPCPCQCLLCG